MARSKIIDVTTDLQTDSGSVLWSIVQGEQLEYPITLSFISNVGLSGAYTFEAVVMEAENNLSTADIPTTPMPSGVNTTLTVRVPLDRGTWNAQGVYNREEVVYYAGLYYKLSYGTNYTSSSTPDIDTTWEVHVPNKIYVQFPSTLSSTWSVQPNLERPVYGFFELSVTENNTPGYARTWKPMRGLVQFLYSPTKVV